MCQPLRRKYHFAGVQTVRISQCTHTQRQSIAYCSRAKENKCHHRTRQKYQISFSYRPKRIFESLTLVDGGTGGGSPELPGDLSNAAA